MWDHLQHFMQEDGSRFDGTLKTLSNLIALSRSATIHDFYAAVLTIHEGRKRFLAGLVTKPATF